MRELENCIPRLLLDKYLDTDWLVNVRDIGLKRCKLKDKEFVLVAEIDNDCGGIHSLSWTCRC